MSCYGMSGYVCGTARAKNITAINDSFSLPVSPGNGLVVVQTTCCKWRYSTSKYGLMYPTWKLRMSAGAGVLARVFIFFP